MSKLLVAVKTDRLTDEEVLFYSYLVRTGMTEEENSDPEKYVEMINYLHDKKYTTLDQVIAVVPAFAIQLEEEDRKLQYRNMGL